MQVVGVLYLAISDYLEGKGGEVKGIHHEAQLVSWLLQEVFQPLIPQTLHVGPHHPCRRAGILILTHTLWQTGATAIIPSFLKGLSQGGDSRGNRNLWDNCGLMCWKCVIYGALECVELNKDGCLSVTEWNVINSTCWVKGEKMESDSLTPAVSHWSAMAPSGFHSFNRKYTDITKSSWIWFLMQKSKKAGICEKQDGREKAIRWNN